MRWLSLAKDERTMIDFIAEIKDEFGSTITNLPDKVDITLTEVRHD